MDNERHACCAKLLRHHHDSLFVKAFITSMKAFCSSAVASSLFCCSCLSSLSIALRCSRSFSSASSLHFSKDNRSYLSFDCIASLSCSILSLSSSWPFTYSFFCFSISDSSSFNLLLSACLVCRYSSTLSVLVGFLFAGGSTGSTL